MPQPVTDWAMPAEIARFLRLELKDVVTLIESDGLPATKIPRKTRFVKRVWLRDLHKWLLSNTSEPGELVNFEEFRKEFQKHRVGVRGKATEKTAA